MIITKVTPYLCGTESSEWWWRCQYILYCYVGKRLRELPLAEAAFMMAPMIATIACSVTNVCACICLLYVLFGPMKKKDWAYSCIITIRMRLFGRSLFYVDTHTLGSRIGWLTVSRWLAGWPHRVLRRFGLRKIPFVRGTTTTTTTTADFRYMRIPTKCSSECVSLAGYFWIPHNVCVRVCQQILSIACVSDSKEFSWFFHSLSIRWGASTAACLRGLQNLAEVILIVVYPWRTAAYRGEAFNYTSLFAHSQSRLI